MLSVTLVYPVTTEINSVRIQNTEQYFMIAGFPIKKSLKFKAIPTTTATIDKTIVAVILFLILLPPMIPKFGG